MRFELSDADLKALRNGAPIAAGINHEMYNYTVSPIAAETCDSLVNDLD